MALSWRWSLLRLPLHLVRVNVVGMARRLCPITSGRLRDDVRGYMSMLGLGLVSSLLLASMSAGLMPTVLVSLPPALPPELLQQLQGVL